MPDQVRHDKVGADHFVGINKMVTLGSGAIRKIEESPSAMLFYAGFPLSRE